MGRWARSVQRSLSRSVAAGSSVSVICTGADLESEIGLIAQRRIDRARVVSRWIALGGLCCLLGLSACGLRSTSEAGDASAVTTPSPAASTAITGTAGTAGTVTASNVGSTATGTTPVSSAASAEQTDPTITPSLGGPHTTFGVRLTARTRLGAPGVVSAVYHIAATGPTEPACQRETAAPINHGEPGQRLQAVLRPAARDGAPANGKGRSVGTGAELRQRTPLSQVREQADRGWPAGVAGFPDQHRTLIDRAAGTRI